MISLKTNLAGKRSLELAILAGVVLVILGVQVFFLVNFNINWDEFLYLSFVFEYSSGTLSRALQTFHVHLFGWMTDLEADEIQLALLGRSVMLACELLTLGFIYLISRRFVSIRFAWFGVLSYLASGFVLIHGFSFRADPMITVLLMASIYLLMERSAYLWKDMAATITIALAFAISIKSVFFAPPLLGALIWRTRQMGGAERKLKIYAGLTLSVSIAFAVLYLWHRNTLAPGIANEVSQLDSVFSKMLIDIPFWPQQKYFRSWITASWPQMLFIFIGFFLLWRRRSREHTVRLLIAVMFALPILSIFFYRNSFPYFFPFIVAPSMIAAAIGAQILSENVSRRFANILLTAVVIYMLTYTLGQAYRYSDYHQIGQRETISAVHTMFPEPSPYIDVTSMIASFPKCGLFMSTWGMESYRKAGKPVFERILEECEPKFLIANANQLVWAMRAGFSEDNPHSLLDRDANTLRSNFIHHWGEIWVAGKRFNLDGSPITFQIPVESIYTVESSSQLRIDGAHYDDGDFVFLSKGAHTVESPPQQIELRIGRNLPRPEYAPTSPIYFGFQ
jgi:hypothetical protein